MAELAKITGVAQGTIFYHYHNKEALFLAILETFKEDITAEFSRYQHEHQFRSGLAMVENVIEFYIHIAAQMEDHFMLLHRHDADLLTLFIHQPNRGQANPLVDAHLGRIGVLTKRELAYDPAPFASR